jgi:hypothetical protein
VLGPDGQYTAYRRLQANKGFSVQEHLMKLAGGFVNGSGVSPDAHSRVAYTESQPGNLAVEPTQTLDLEVQDSSNATV